VIPALANKHVFVFDWDGTLFDSMAAKTLSFAAVMHDWMRSPGAIASIPASPGA
jgi:phosphoglycolate phosphatase-like HAD superfamily hydrolase